MKYTKILVGCLFLVATGCVVETRQGSNGAASPTPPPPPPPPGVAPAYPPSAPAQPPETAPLPPPSGSGLPEYTNNRPIPRDPKDPPPSTAPLPSQPPAQPPPPAPPDPPQTVYVPDGVPNIPAGAPAYWIWRAAPGVWKVRTSSNVLAVFTGRAVIQKDKLSQLTITRAELNRYVDVKHDASKQDIIWFSFATKDQTEGFDFTSENPASCVYFDLVTSTTPAKQIFVGANGQRAPSRHFILCPKK